MTEQTPPTKAIVTVLATYQNMTNAGKPWLKVATQAHGDFSVWDATLWPKIPNGGVLAIEYQTNDRGFKIITAVAPRTPPIAPDANSTINGADPRNWSITRQTALKAAVDAMGEMPPGGAIHDYCDAVMKTADIFHAWLLSQGTWDETF